MIARLLKRRPRVTAPVNPSVPEGAIVWAIGDIHGRLDLVEPLVDVIRAEASLLDEKRKIVVFLGDYIDRGPTSRGVLQYLAQLPTDAGVEWRFLKGNHEDAMLEFLADPSFGPEWMEYGGDATIASYGLRLPQMRHQPEAWVHLAADLDHRVSSEERSFLENLELSLTIGDYFFAHAGARPGQALDRQSHDDLMWIRKSFLDNPGEFEKIVVHGHTPVPEVYFDHRRIGVDTKAYESGVLTALRLEASGQHLIACADGVVTPAFDPSRRATSAS